VALKSGFGFSRIMNQAQLKPQPLHVGCRNSGNAVD
jgi:hypothetical protein